MPRGTGCVILSQFRSTVGASFALSYFFSLASLLLLPLLPSQKQEAQVRAGACA